MDIVCDYTFYKKKKRNKHFVYLLRQLNAISILNSGPSRAVFPFENSRENKYGRNIEKGTTDPGVDCFDQ